MRHFPSGWSGSGSLCWARPREKSSSSASSAVSGGRTAACGGFPRRSSRASWSPASRKRPGTCAWGQVSTCHMEGQVSTCHILSSRPKPALPASARRRAGSSSSTGVSSSRSAERSGGHSCAASDARLSIDLTNLASTDARESWRLPIADDRLHLFPAGLIPRAGAVATSPGSIVRGCVGATPSASQRTFA